MVTEILGFAGTILIVFAYAPQISYLIKKHCSGGLSLKAWGIWLIATALILIHATTTNDLVFKVLQIANFIAIAAILMLANRYKGNVCKMHKLPKHH